MELIYCFSYWIYFRSQSGSGTVNAVQVEVFLGEHDLSVQNEAGEQTQVVTNAANIIPHENYDINSNVSKRLTNKYKMVPLLFMW